MRYSEYFLPTTREIPADAELASHIYCLRAGLIRKVASGIYIFLPLGMKVLQKIETIIRQEMNAKGAQEVLMPVLQPKELWEKSGRWTEYGPEMMRLRDRHERDFCLGPTHEELITSTVDAEIFSYKKLPLHLYQIQVKFRDEIRPRFGLLRGREFIMKDGYCFCSNQKELEVIYQKMYEAYARVLERCGLDYAVVEAESGIIGGEVSHEFVVLADAGESELVLCPGCGYASNAELAHFSWTTIPDREDMQEAALVETAGIKTIEALAHYLSVEPKKTIKTMLVQEGKNIFAILIRGDRELSLAKSARHLRRSIGLVEQDTLSAHPEIRMGYVGPFGLNAIPILADLELKESQNMVIGANRDNFHMVNANVGRDFQVDQWGDFTYPVWGDKCSKCANELEFKRGIEVGHIFQLGTKYSKSLGATFIDEDGQSQNFVMGCFGIGVTRLLASIIEQKHDERGIIWPVSVAPFQVIILLLNPTNNRQREAAEHLYEIFQKHGLEVLLDDRDERAGVKFTDAELLGIPFICLIGNKLEREGLVEVKIRESGDSFELPLEGVVFRIQEIMGNQERGIQVDKGDTF
ncbi:MAG: Proline--tRNA ligase [Actinobacteria bacterium]|nr:Proline--tRNA ligase [Actinomycetota bacterium]